MPDEFSRLEDQLFPGLKTTPPGPKGAEPPPSGDDAPPADENKRRRVRIRRGGAAEPTAPVETDVRALEFRGTLQRKLTDLGGRTPRPAEEAPPAAPAAAAAPRPAAAPQPVSARSLPPASRPARRRVRPSAPPAPVAAARRQPASVPMAWWQVDVDTEQGPQSFVVDGPDVAAAVLRARNELGDRLGARPFDLRGVSRVDVLV